MMDESQGLMDASEKKLMNPDLDPSPRDGLPRFQIEVGLADIR